MRSLRLPESVFMPKFQSLHKTRLPPSSSPLLFNSHSHKQHQQKHKFVKPPSNSDSSRYSRQRFRAEGWNGLSTQSSTSKTHDTPVLGLFRDKSYSTLGATHIPSGSADVDISHDHTSINIGNAATTWMSSVSWMKFPMLISMLTLLDSQQALAGSELSTGLQSLPYLGDLGDISTGFASAFLLIFFSELGDKTFFIAAILAARNSGLVIFIGTFGALALMTVISVVLGRTFHYVDDILPFSFGGTDLPLDDIAAVCLLIYFGVSTLIEAASGDGQKTEEEKNEAEIAVSEFSGDGAGLLAAANTVFSTFLVVFVAEWGDKSFFSTIALAAASSPLGVIGGALAGHAAATLLAVLGGSLLGTFLSEKAVAYVGGTLFLVFAAVTLIEIVT